MEDPMIARRSFLARIGLLGLASSGLASGILSAGPATAAPLDLGVLRQLLQTLSLDTYKGLAAFVVPGDDAYSHAQGTADGTPGAIAAKAPQFLMDSLDDFVGLPDTTVRYATQALATGLAGSNVDVPGLSLLPGQVLALDNALTKLLATDETIPLSLPVAGLLNLVATQVNPASVNGLFVSPFARLSFADKAKAFEMIETTESGLVAKLDVNLPEPLAETVSGVLKFVAGAVIEFTAWGTYSEYAAFDPKSKTLDGRPVGWKLAHYDHRAEGYDSFRGYYQGRKKVSHA
ncbi:hypothetical protein J2S40_002460 [Nocardioides luteus]|uniref:Uncharacterized protein n=1 Tax=Nocardioides luteus TaxID=1844 RepID=A0ABQ5SSY2_9ACTN|nr:hypothetical protein [Nocardioides luteus]MDR7311402.1 hypothetical protein [Nocardioides luteus]GGR65660.1 hypothetical protein GCM10010197_36560 [Nocardioides luteus]GLJ66906.1 hypothetical protein GCM10017579_09420 [Nocardioides luteus]